jgi:hypothetical protein
MDPSNPHAINRLHIDYLGRKEILLTASDDGDIVGYYISGIMAAIEKQDPDYVDCNFVKPFFRINVKKTAWGLAVHRQARLIAISANSHEVTVVAFKLATSADETKEGQKDGLHDQAWFSVRTLRAGNNIPSVSFNNTGTDPSGRWLVGNVIDGSTQLWDLHRGPNEGSRKLYLGHCILTPKGNVSVQHPHCRDYVHSAWGAIFVDPRWCHFSKSKSEAFGGRPRWRDANIWDTTVSVLNESADYPSAEPWKYINPNNFWLPSATDSDSDEDESPTTINHQPVFTMGTPTQLETIGDPEDGEDDSLDLIRHTKKVMVPVTPSQFLSNPNGFYANSTSFPDSMDTEGSKDNVRY